jgi:hypothetical protein
LDDLSNSAPAVRLYSRGRETARPEDGTGKGEIMPHDNVMVEVRRMFGMTDFDPEILKEIQKKFGDADMFGNPETILKVTN